MVPHQPSDEYSVPKNVVWIDGAEVGMAEELYLTIVPAGRTVLLKDTARLIWLLAANGRNVRRQIAQLTGLPAAETEGDIAHFLADLTGRGLLIRWSNYGAPAGPQA